jgi:GNAT superfamily N-acetyltransferase
MHMHEWTQGEYTISTDRNRLDLAVIQHYLAEESYWAKGRPAEITRQVIEHSLCFGVYYKIEQIGFARVITDYATHAYLSDLFILPAHQGQGVGKWLMQCILTYPATEAVYKWALHTRDAHGLYAQFGFAPPSEPALYMEIRKSPSWVAT